MKKSGFLFAAMVAAAGICGIGGAGEEYMPLVPGAFSPADFADDGTPLRRVSSNDPDMGESPRPALRKNIIRLTVPSLGRPAESKMRMMEAAPGGEDGTIQFRQPGARYANIPGLVEPEILALSRMEQERDERNRARKYTPISLPSSLGTEELMEFDPYSVQRTGNPFKDTPGEAQAFPAAATQSQAWEWETGAFANSDLRPPQPEKQSPLAPPLPVPAPPVASASAGVSGGASLRPVGAGASGTASASSLRPSGASLMPPPLPPPATRQTVAISLPSVAAAQPAAVPVVIPARAPAAFMEQPPLPELPVGFSGAVQARRADAAAALAVLPPFGDSSSDPMPPVSSALPASPARPLSKARRELAPLMMSSQAGVSAGLALALPPTAMTEAGEPVRPVLAQQPVAPKPVVALGPSLQPGEKIIEPQTQQIPFDGGAGYAVRFGQIRNVAQIPVSANAVREHVEQPAPAPRAISGVPTLSSEEFVPMRGRRGW